MTTYQNKKIFETECEVKTVSRFIAFWIIALFPLQAQAYVGPSLGLATIAVIVGFIASIIFGLLGFLWYPIKRLIKRIKKNDDD